VELAFYINYFIKNPKFICLPAGDSSIGVVLDGSYKPWKDGESNLQTMVLIQTQVGIYWI